MAEASVFTSVSTGEPVECPARIAETILDAAPDLQVETLHIVSEWSLRIAVKALQHIYGTSACPGSRAVAGEALRAVGLTDDLPTDPTGRPTNITLEAHERLDRLNLVGNPYRRWDS